MEVPWNNRFMGLFYGLLNTNSEITQTIVWRNDMVIRGLICILHGSKENILVFLFYE